MFQMFYMYHQVTILAYKILLKEYQYTTISWLNIEVNLINGLWKVIQWREVTNVIRLKRITSKGLAQVFCLTMVHHDVSKDFLANLFKVIASISQNRNLHIFPQLLFIIVVFNYFYQKLCLKSCRGFWISVAF